MWSDIFSSTWYPSLLHVPVHVYSFWLWANWIDFATCSSLPFSIDFFSYLWKRYYQCHEYLKDLYVRVHWGRIYQYKTGHVFVTMIFGGYLFYKYILIEIDIDNFPTPLMNESLSLDNCDPLPPLAAKGYFSFTEYSVSWMGFCYV